jgi:hypothetical protein
MTFAELPRTAAWKHRHARDGFEVAFFEVLEVGYRVLGSTAAVEDGSTWTVTYDIELDHRWKTSHASITCRSARGMCQTVLETDGFGHWRVDGVAAPALDGCLDVDLESSALTNAFPVHRLDLGIGQHAAAPAAYVRVDGLAVSRLEQSYDRIADGTNGQRYHYAAPIFEFSCQLAYDDTGLLIEYPGIADRTS